jgi:response regulator RpfG family c-di-GMP phosphodiesterase
MPEKKDFIFCASLLHDVGAVIYGEYPLMFPSLEEQKKVHTILENPAVSARIISKINTLKGACDYLQYHHEWYDGSGYSGGKKGDEISVGAQLIRIADTVSSLSDNMVIRKLKKI